MIDKIQDLIKEVEAFSSKSLEEIEQFRIKFLAKKGIVTELFNELKTFQKMKRRSLGRY
jgi:phenylalanyl-tRNA synthetase alpha chain